MTPSVDSELSRAKQSLAWRRWTAVITTSASGIVLVALAARVATAAAVVVALFTALATAASAWRAAAEHRRWRHVLDVPRARRASAWQER
jgi:hypothetical protein